MEKKKVTINNGGIGFCGALAIAFIVLKLIGAINWSWFWVLSPIIFGCGFVLIILILALVAAIIVKKKGY